jgi:hypothetical protein
MKFKLGPHLQQNTSALMCRLTELYTYTHKLYLFPFRQPSIEVNIPQIQYFLHKTSEKKKRFL